jgi:hypothetical protein
MPGALPEEHRQLLRDTSGLLDAVIDARGYWSPTADVIAGRVADALYRPEVMKAGGWLACPVIRPDGVTHC